MRDLRKGGRCEPETDLCRTFDCYMQIKGNWKQWIVSSATVLPKLFGIYQLGFINNSNNTKEVDNTDKLLGEHGDMQTQDKTVVVASIF